ncbi:unnamed protein product [Acanthoscelides obtectus]|uniref:Uncharacterized protein n=1 Tax=Acanthoscelides obtectus TaxID=200917 RepID=A0A9P0PKW8_ACAOB|nr:unnamed protein product [Acanthoscelides obtectus]CAK1677729.1 hypothetical protein AOBTE_LOCUS31518 [Acanthoscelides obtectus]
MCGCAVWPSFLLHRCYINRLIYVLGIFSIDNISEPRSIR